jgi:hypothetical protein
MKNFLIETAIIARDVFAGMLLTSTVVSVIALWIVLDVRI